MEAIFRQGGRAQLLNVRSWPFWKLPRPLIAFVAAVVLVDVAALAVCAAALPVRAHDLEVFALLLACNGATVELTRRTSEPEGHVKDVHAVWELPVVVLLPPFYALLMPLLRLALTQWRIRLPAVYKRVFTAAAISLSYACASLAFRRRALARPDLGEPGARLPRHGLAGARGGLRGRAGGREPVPRLRRGQGGGPAAPGRGSSSSAPRPCAPT